MSESDTPPQNTCGDLGGSKQPQGVNSSAQDMCGCDDLGGYRQLSGSNDPSAIDQEGLGVQATLLQDQIPGIQNINFDAQAYGQRKWMFGVVLGVCFILYLAALTLVFCPVTQLKDLIEASPQAIFLPITLLILPTITLGVLAKAVYKVPQHPTDMEAIVPATVTSKTYDMMVK